MADQDLKELLLVEEEAIREPESIEKPEKSKIEPPREAPSQRSTVVLSTPKLETGEQRSSLGRKLLLGAILTALIPLIISISVLGLTAQNSSEEAIIEGAQDQLVSIRDAKKRQIEDNFEIFSAQVINFASSIAVIEMMELAPESFEDFILEANGGEPLSIGEIARRKELVTDYYNTTYLSEFQRQNGGQDIDTAALLSSFNDTTFALQYQYIVDNPNELGDKDNLAEVDDGSGYDEVHALFHESLEQFAETFGYYDIFLVEPENGHIVYSVEKEIDFATSLIDGPYANTPIGEAFRQAVTNVSLGPQAYFADADFYAPSYNSNEMFVATPVFANERIEEGFASAIELELLELEEEVVEEEGEILGILIFQIPSRRLDSIMTNDNEWRALGLGETGETFLVGPSKLAGFDYTLRSNSRFFVEDSERYLDAIAILGIPQNIQDSMVSQGTVSGRQPINTPGVQAVFENESGTDTFLDYRGVAVYSAYTPLDIPGLNWGLMSQKDQVEIVAPVDNLRRTVLGLSLGFLGVATLIIILATTQFVRGITRPVTQMVEIIEKVGQGDLSETVPVSSNDEIGVLASSFNNSIVRLRDSVQTEQERDDERRRREELQSNIGGFLDVMMDVAGGDLTKRGEVSEDVLGNVVDATNVMLEEMGYLLKEVQDTAQGVGQSASDMIQTTETISKDSQARVTRANQLAQAVAKVSDSISEMAKSADKSAQTAQDTLQASQQGGKAVENTLIGMQGIRREVQSISKRIKTLGDRSLEISEIADTISDLSRQTNLLSLNAAIEAAGAGEAGERFAVVANEVRKLAIDSSDSTQRVSELIKNIQEEVQDVITTVEDGIREVESGYQVANEAGERLKEIGESAQDSAQIADLIAEVTRDQVNRIGVINTNLKNMAVTGTESLKIVEQGRKSAENLQQSSKSLIQNLEHFRLEA